jgi:hypothetical protein
MAGIGFTLGDQPLEHAAELLAHVHATGLVALRSIDAASAEGTLASIRFLKRPEPPVAWLVQLLGPQDALERLPTLMQGEEYTIVRFENGIHLSGSAFDGLSDAAAVRARAEEVCRHLESILQLYVGLADQFRPGNVLQLINSSTGTPRLRNLLASLEVRVI